MALLHLFGVHENWSPVFAEAGGDQFRNESGLTDLVVWVDPDAGGVAPVTVTVTTVRPCPYGDHSQDWTATVFPGGPTRFRPFVPFRYNDPRGRVSVAYSSVAGVKVASQLRPG